MCVCAIFCVLVKVYVCLCYSLYVNVFVCLGECLRMCNRNLGQPEVAVSLPCIKIYLSIAGLD